MTQNSLTIDGTTYKAAPPAFPDSVNKCTGCAFHATKHSQGCERLPVTCLGSLREDFRDVIWQKQEQTK